MGALALRFLVLTLTGWLQREQYGVAQYLIEENRVLSSATSSLMRQTPSWQYDALGHTRSRRATATKLHPASAVSNFSIESDSRNEPHVLELYSGIPNVVAPALERTIQAFDSHRTDSVTATTVAFTPGAGFDRALASS